MALFFGQPVQEQMPRPFEGSTQHYSLEDLAQNCESVIGGTVSSLRQFTRSSGLPVTEVKWKKVALDISCDGQKRKASDPSLQLITTHVGPFWLHQKEMEGQELFVFLLRTRPEPGVRVVVGGEDGFFRVTPEGSVQNGSGVFIDFRGRNGFIAAVQDLLKPRF